MEFLSVEIKNTLASCLRVSGTFERAKTRGLQLLWSCEPSWGMTAMFEGVHR